MPSETVSEGIEQFYRRRRVTVSGRKGFLFPLADRFAAFVDDFTLLFVLNDADRQHLV